MLASSPFLLLTEFFENSVQFYFFLADKNQQILHANPLFQDEINSLPANGKRLQVTDVFLNEDVSKYTVTIHEINNANTAVRSIRLNTIQKNKKYKNINWEFSASTKYGNTEIIQAIGTVIQESSQEQQQLKQSELFYRNMISHSLDAVVLTNEKGFISFASDSIKEILGYETYEVIGKTLFDFAHADDHLIAITSFQEELAKKPRIKFIRIRLQKKSGEYTWCNVRGHNKFDNPHVRQMMIYFYDDSLRNQTENALMESEKRFHNQAIILNNVTEVIVTTDMNRVVTSWNKIIEKLTGISAVAAIGKPYRELIASDYSPYTREQVADIVFKEGIWRGEVSFVGSDGEKKYLLHTISIFKNEEGENIGLLGVGKDITHKKKAEEKLLESELFYRNMISHSLDGILMADKAGKLIYCGPSAEKVSGYKPEQLLGKSFFEFIHPEDRTIAFQAFDLEVKRKSVLKYLLTRLQHANGTWIWCSVRSHNLLDKPGVNAIVIYFTNDSKRKEIEEKLRESESQFRNLIKNLRQGVLLQNEKGENIICNQATLEMLGISEEELFERKPDDIKWKLVYEDGSLFPTHLYPAIVARETKKPVRDVVMGVDRPLTKDRIWLLVNAQPVLDNQNKLLNVICSFTDITLQKQLSAELIAQEVNKQKLLTQATIDGQENERLEIGKELHDNINQHLTTTRLYLEMAKEKATGEVKEMIDQSHKNLVTIITEIRLLSQSLVPPTLGDLGLVESIQDLCGSLKRTHWFSIEFLSRYFNDENLADNLKLMLFRITQEQVNNIIRHANATHVKITLQSDAENTILSIVDDGKGFDLNTTKRGQGFNNITNRAALFNGTVEIITAAGKGCTLLVNIPSELSKEDK